MSESGNDTSSDRRVRTERTEEVENSLRPVRRRMKAVVVPVAAAAVPVPKEKKRHSAKRTEPVPVPEEVRRGFVQLKNSYFFPDGARAFTDRGDRLTTPSENTEVIRSLVAIAQARGWGEVVVGGSERFRRDAWAAAHAAGLEVRGYKPTQFEQTRLVRSLASRSIPEGSGGPPSDAHRATERSSRSAPERAEGGPTAGALLAGMLVEHGRGPYQHDLKEPISYYVKIETPKGDRTIWGVDLERAFKESLTQPQAGDAVGLRSIRREPVKVKSAQRDGEGNVVSQKDLETHRNHWVVEKQAFFEQRAQAAQTLRDTSIDPKQGGRQHPELVGTYLQVRAAELAAKKLRDPQDQARFVERVREALANSVASGEPLPPVRLREERTVEPRARAARTPEPALARA